MIRHTNLFENCSTGVEDLTDPDGAVVGKVFIILDNDTGDVWKCPMAEKAAKRNGQMLMGITRVHVAQQEELKSLLGGSKQ